VTPELIRRAIDRKRGRERYRCRTWRHRLNVWLLSRNSISDLERRLIAKQVRLDPPGWARDCSCEQGQP
jgi:hypothetical protein